MQYILPVVTLLLSGVVAASAAYLLNSRKDHVFAMRTKAEDLLTALFAWEDMYLTRVEVVNHYLAGRMTGNDLLEKTEGSSRSSDTERVKVLILIYFPQLEERYQDLLRAESDHGRAVHLMRICIDEIEDKAPYALDFGPKTAALEEASRAMIVATLIEARDVASKRALLPSIRRRDQSHL